MSKKVLVTGCSMTRGHGLRNEQDDKCLWVNALLPNCIINNYAVDGANNYSIFMQTLAHLRQNYYDVVLVGWSAIPRWCFNVGLELYQTHTVLRDDGHSINTNDGGHFTSKWLGETGDRLRKIQNDHWDLLDLVAFVNVIRDIQVTMRGGKLVFVNTLGPWPSEYFERKNISLPDELDEFEKVMYNINNRDDEEILTLYNKVHDDYKYNGGIRSELWLNLYNSLASLQQDTVSAEDLHPGYASQAHYTDAFKNKIDRMIAE